MRSVLPHALLGLLLVLPASLAAQYRTSPADTLRYVERTDGVVTIGAPAGPVQVRVTQESLIGVTLPRPGEAQAWYEQLSVRKEGPGPGVERLGTDVVLGQPFRLSFTPHGAVSATVVPEFPEELSRVTDLRQQFDDFFISLPASELRVGSAWADTLVREQTRGPGDSHRSRSVRSYRVERDTVLASGPALIISLRQEIESEASAPMEGQLTHAASRLKGTEEGFAVFSSVRGRLVSRERRGTLAGSMSLEGGPTPVTMPHRYEYTSTIALQP